MALRAWRLQDPTKRGLSGSTGSTAETTGEAQVNGLEQDVCSVAITDPNFVVLGASR